MFLLSYTQKFSLKRTDVVNFSLSILTLSVAMIAVIVSLSSGIHNDTNVLAIFGLAELIIVSVIIYVIFDLRGRMKKNNDLILKIEKKINRNYDYINGKSDDEKDCILEEFYQVFTEKKDHARLLELLSRPSKN